MGRPFKIPGVRRLLKTYGPTEPFKRSAALQLIGCKDPANPKANFKDYENLFIEPRPYGSKLTPSQVFTYLVDKGLFRIGTELACPNCRMTSWISLDLLKQKVVCELCGQEHDSTRQLVEDEWHYRRTGILGAEKNNQGAVPVILTLHRLDNTLHGLREGSNYSPSLDLVPNNGMDIPKCEIDFVWMIPRVYPRKTVVILAECKDQLPIDANDIANLKRVADAFPRKRFKTFVLLTRLRPFTAQEIELALTLNDEDRKRAILLTARELEPQFIYERTKLEISDLNEHAVSPEDLADATAQIYFKERSETASGEWPK